MLSVKFEKNFGEEECEGLGIAGVAEDVEETRTVLQLDGYVVSQATGSWDKKN